MGLVFVANRLACGFGSTNGFWSLFPYVSVPVVLITVLVNWFMPAPRSANGIAGIDDEP